MDHIASGNAISLDAAANTTLRVGLSSRIRVTFQSLSQIHDPARAEPAPGRDSSTSPPLQKDLIEILKRLSRRPVEPTDDTELLADLGFDSLLVLELVGELEERFDITVPLNDLTHIRTVGQITAEVERLVADQHVEREP